MSRDHFDDLTLAGDGFELRPLGDSDLDDIVRACSDPLTQRWLPLPRPYTRSSAEAFVHEIAPAALHAGTGIVRAVEVDRRLCGAIDLKTTDWVARTAEIGYWIAPWARGHGLAGRAAACLADWALRAQGMARVEIRAAEGNVGSQKSALAAGFSREGVLRSAGFTHDGRVDLVVFGRTLADVAAS